MVVMDLIASLAGVIMSSSALLMIYLGMRWQRKARQRSEDKKALKQLMGTFE